MFEQKKAISFPKSQVKEIEFNEQKFLVNPYMTNEDMAIIIGVYLETLFDKNTVDPEFNLHRAKNMLIVSVIDRMTNIELPPSSMNDIFSNMSLIKKIQSSIENYDDFEQRLHATSEMMKDKMNLEKSLGSVIESLADKFSGFMESISNTENMNALVKSIQDTLKETQDSPLIKDTMEILK